MADIFVSKPTGADVLAFLGWPSDAEVLAQAEAHVSAVATQVKAYTRGRGFMVDGLTIAEDIAPVIVSATARSLNNPAQAKRIEAGSFNTAPGSLASFTLLESLILNGYRQRAG